uniref:Uncharacterized protein n=1 Tax=Plectus sambesii TaxID=2011161 RepID=A0A914XN01_9BILA
MDVQGLLLICLRIVLIIGAFLYSHAVESVKCFCDKRNCEDSLICSGKWCLVGFKTDVRLDQLCATDEAEALQNCALEWNGWSEVCACQEDFCNTFAFLRGNIERHQMDVKHGPGTLDNGNGAFGPTVFDVDQSGGADERPRYQSNNLIVLLVIIPLTVGGLAVCLIFVNYHCKMC